MIFALVKRMSASSTKRIRKLARKRRAPAGSRGSSRAARRRTRSAVATAQHRLGVGMSDLPTRVSVLEVGPRDGLQAEERFVPTDEKVELVDALSHTGVERIQVTSFVRAEWIPALADAAEVMARIERVEGVEYDVLIPNRRGLGRALEAAADSVYLVVSASATHNRRNLN